MSLASLSEAPLPLRCPDCEGAPRLSALRDTLLLLCGCGRQIPLEALTDVPPAWGARLEALRRDWDERLAGLRALSADARRKGYANIGELVDRQAAKLEARVRALRDLARPPSAPR